MGRFGPSTSSEASAGPEKYRGVRRRKGCYWLVGESRNPTPNIAVQSATETMNSRLVT